MIIGQSNWDIHPIKKIVGKRVKQKDRLSVGKILIGVNVKKDIGRQWIEITKQCGLVNSSIYNWKRMINSGMNWPNKEAFIVKEDYGQEQQEGIEKVCLKKQYF